MKTGNIFSNAPLLPQSKSAREDKSTDRKEPSKTVKDKVDLSTTGIPATSTPAPYEEVLQLLYGIDFSQMRNTEWISKDGVAQLTELVQLMKS